MGGMSLKSDRFRRLWARHDVRSAAEVMFRIQHPQAGSLKLLVEKFQLVGASRLEKMLLHTEPCTRSADTLALLASLGMSS
ncbi:MmyB family transcriptional regulator [Streptomyces tendae]|uniref:MmyB family transcriptional regulator n=1 Tax=Streptomyces tendae TaxID=1932 RepID=UPI00367B011F